jgi:RHS repeat-associated protein
VRLAFRANHNQASANTVTVDDLQVWAVPVSGELVRGVPARTTLDARGAVIASIAPPTEAGGTPLVTTSEYDAMGRLTTRTAAAAAGGGTTAADVNLATAYTYDELGNQLSATDPAGVVTRSSFDRLGRQVASVANYDAADPTTLTDLKNITATAAYNDRGELVATCAPNAVKVDACDVLSTNPLTAPYQSGWHYGYDVMGNLVAEVPPNNVTLTDIDLTEHVYDAPGLRVVSTCRYALAGSCATASRHTDLTYDDLGRITQSVVYQGAGTTQPKIRTTTTFDGLGRPLQTARYLNGSGTADDTIDATYDSLGRLDQLTRAGAILTDYAWNGDGTLYRRGDGAAASASGPQFAYDRRDRLVQSADPSQFTGSVSQGWTLGDQLATRTLPDGSVTTWTFDALRRPLDATTVDGGSTPATFSTAYDRVGNVVSETRSLAGISGHAGGGSQTFTYDALRRLTGSALGSDSRAYTYDAGNRRLSATTNGATVSWTYDRVDQLSSQSGGGTPTAYVYDRYGNLTTRATPAGGTTFAYDHADGLTAISPSGGSAAAFSHDALGRLRTRSVGALTDTYAYLGTSETVWRIASGAGSLSSVLDADGQRLALDAGSGPRWLLADLHGSLAAGYTGTAIDAALRYDGYGLTLAATGSSPPWRYQGRLELSPDPAHPLYENGARELDPGLGAFTALDPVAGSLARVASLNRYAYAHANPTSLTDPSGQAVPLYPRIDGEYVNPTWRPSAVPATGSPPPTAWTPTPTPTAPTLDGPASGWRLPDVVLAPSFASTVMLDAVDAPLPYQDSYVFATQVLDPYFPWRSNQWMFEPDREQLLRESYVFLRDVTRSDELAYDLFYQTFGAGAAMFVTLDSHDVVGSAIAVGQATLGPGELGLAAGPLARWAAGRLGGQRPVVIGENMERVRAFADSIGGTYYRPRGDIREENWMRNNMAWVRRVIRSGAPIVDIGPDWPRRALRGGNDSPYYQGEVQRAIEYENYFYHPLP